MERVASGSILGIFGVSRSRSLALTFKVTFSGVSPIEHTIAALWPQASTYLIPQAHIHVTGKSCDLTITCSTLKTLVSLWLHTLFYMGQF